MEQVSKRKENATVRACDCYLIRFAYNDVHGDYHECYKMGLQTKGNYYYKKVRVVSDKSKLYFGSGVGLDRKCINKPIIVDGKAAVGLEVSLMDLYEAGIHGFGCNLNIDDLKKINELINNKNIHASREANFRNMARKEKKLATKIEKTEERNREKRRKEMYNSIEL